MDQSVIARSSGLKPEQVTFHGIRRRWIRTTRNWIRICPEAAVIAKRLRGTQSNSSGCARTMFVVVTISSMHTHRVELVLADGLPAAWRHVIVGQSLLAGTPLPDDDQNRVDRLRLKVPLTRITTLQFHVSYIIQR